MEVLITIDLVSKRKLRNKNNVDDSQKKYVGIHEVLKISINIKFENF